MVNITQATAQEIHGLHYCGCAEPRRAYCDRCGADFCQVCGGRIVGASVPEAPQPGGDARLTPASVRRRLALQVGAVPESPRPAASGDGAE